MGDIDMISNFEIALLVEFFRGLNHIDLIHQPRPEEPTVRSASRRTATGEAVPAAILRDAVLRTAPQDEVHGPTLSARSD
jgi:hypothetical protein